MSKRAGILIIVGLLSLTEMASAFYDANVGRWLNRDPLGEYGGQNLYAFVGNDPLNQIDPKGLITWPWGKKKCPPVPPGWLVGPSCAAWLAAPDDSSCLLCCTEQFVMREAQNVGKGVKNMAIWNACNSKCMLSGGLKGPTLK